MCIAHETIGEGRQDLANEMFGNIRSDHEIEPVIDKWGPPTFVIAVNCLNAIARR
jgi:hypothetical protein